MDWIRAKADWSPEKALAALKQRMQDDVEEWRGLVGKKESAWIRVENSPAQNAINELTVERLNKFGVPDRWVGIALAPNQGVKYRCSPDGEELVLHARLNRSGEPRLRLGDRAETEDKRREQDLELWQASRFILETLLF
jgi:hypothetical protein